MPYTPRLKQKYKEEIVSALVKEHNYKTVMQVPKITKIVINMGWECCNPVLPVSAW